MLLSSSSPSTTSRRDDDNAGRIQRFAQGETRGRITELGEMTGFLADSPLSFPFRLLGFYNGHAIYENGESPLVLVLGHVSL